MTKFRNRPAQKYIAIVVKPASDFRPTNWRDTPRNYEVLELVGPKDFRGRADAWRFVENKAELDRRKSASLNPIRDAVERWAIVVD